MKNAYNTSAYGSFAYVYDILLENVSGDGTGGNGKELYGDRGDPETGDGR